MVGWPNGSRPHAVIFSCRTPSVLRPKKGRLLVHTYSVILRILERKDVTGKALLFKELLEEAESLSA